MKKKYYAGCSIVMVLTLILWGCTGSKGKFNTDYLPDAVADEPGQRIDFDNAQNQTIDSYLTFSRSYKEKYDAGLYWMNQDRVFLNLEDETIFSIDIKDREISESDSETRAEINQVLSKKVNVINTATLKGALTNIVSSLFSSVGQHYTGDISVGEPNSLEVDIRTKEIRNDTSMDAITCLSSQLVGKFTINGEKNIAVQWDYPCPWLPRSIADIKIPQILRKVQVSPAGRHLFYNTMLYDARGDGTEQRLVWDYTGIICTAINPEWTTLAILRGKKGQYWIEFYDLRL